MKKEEFIGKLKDLQSHLNARTARPEDVLEEVRIAVEEYGIRNEWEELRENYKTSYELEEMLKEAIDQGAERLYYFIGDLENLSHVEIIYVDNYGNCDRKIGTYSFSNVIDEILDSLGK